MREKDNNKRRPMAGIMLTLLYMSKKAKALIVAGAILLAIGFIGGLYFGAIVVNQASQGTLNTVTSSPYPVNGMDPFFAEKLFIGIAILGVAVLALGLASRGRDKSNIAKLK
jgi:dipeptide/tripeptide permease